MTPNENKLMPWLQAGAAMLILVAFFAALFTVLLRPIAADARDIAAPMIEVLKAVVLILVGFLFGTSVSSAKKDDANAALTAQIVATPALPAPPVAPAPVAIPPTNPVNPVPVPPTLT